MALFLVVSFSHAIGRERPLIQLSDHTGNTAVVANMQAGSVSIINLSNYTVSNVTLPAGAAHTKSRSPGRRTKR